MSSVKLRCFQHCLFESNHFLGFLTNLHFWRSILPKTCFGWLVTKLGFSEITKNSVFPFSLLNYVALSFIAQNTCFGFFAIKLCCFQRYWTAKGFFQFAASHSKFHLILLKTTFSFVFSLMFLTTGFSLSSYVNCVFDPLSYRQHVLVCWQWNWKLWALCYKKAAIWFPLRNTLLSVS